HLTGFVMGVVNPEEIPDLPASLTFNANSAQLTTAHKKLLTTVALKMKVLPNINISIQAYPNAAKKSQTLCNLKLEYIRRFLIEDEGISPERITINSEIGGGDINVVDLKQNR